MNHLCNSLLVGLLIGTLGGASSATAQLKHHRNHPLVRRAFRAVVDQSRLSTVRVMADGEQLAMGAIVDADGWVVSKASQLQDNIVCQLPAGENYDAKVMATDSDHDLALLKFDASKSGRLPTVTWRDTDPPLVGSWLATTGTGAYPVAIGVVSVPSRRIDPRRGFLGVGLDQTEGGIRINEVLKNSAAAKAGLQVNDLITHINGKAVLQRGAMVGRISGMRPGEEVRLRIRRDDKPLTVTAKLGTPDLDGQRADRFTRMNSLGGDLSRRRAGFPTALQHDTVLKPNQCGGPIVDLDGNAVGINIARAGRTNSYAIPAEVVKQLVAQWKRSGVLRSAEREVSASPAL